MRWLFVFLALTVIAYLPAQEERLPDWDIDSLFDEPLPETESNSEESESSSSENTAAVRELIGQRGFNFNLSSEFMAGVAPGWYELPWAPSDDRDYYLERMIKMRTSLTMDAQISSVFRVRNTVYFEIPSFALKLGDFFFDYAFYDRVFFRGGKYNISWGISPNYNFTNLPARIPYEDNRFKNDSFILRADIPVGIGGFQVLALTRANLLDNASADVIKKEDIGYGIKYNLALRQADLDMGLYYQMEMPLRGFLSIKTTVRNTEIYSEGLISIDTEQASNVSGAVSLGFSRDFFDNKFSVNGELFYNAEKGAFEYRPETNVREAEIYPLVGGLNAALNLLYRFGDKWNIRLFFQMRYAIFENSAQLVPGFRLAPWNHIDIYFAVPMSLGNEDGYYRKNTFRMDTVSYPNRPLPFSVILMVTLKGDIQFGHYY